MPKHPSPSLARRLNLHDSIVAVVRTLTTCIHETRLEHYDDPVEEQVRCMLLQEYRRARRKQIRKLYRLI